MMKSANLCALLAILASVTVANPSNAATIQFTLENAIDEFGDSFAGTFDFNTVNFQFTNIDLNASGPNTYSEPLTTFVISQADQDLIAGNTADNSRISFFLEFRLRHTHRTKGLWMASALQLTRAEPMYVTKYHHAILFLRAM